jgi:hypothetical protein
MTLCVAIAMYVKAAGSKSTTFGERIEAYNGCRQSEVLNQWAQHYIENIGVSR